MQREVIAAFTPLLLPAVVENSETTINFDVV
jgi:hypothetical protein